ncbi:KLRBC protein, partial [Picathartes gymnocephalus]|nr:KLRBC protein [Picathartes gymnocephalus]
PSASPLLLPPSQEFLNESLQKSVRYYWIGLWVPTAETGWTWVNGSRLDRDRVQLDLGEQPGTCGAIRGNSIIPDNCDLDLQWICQREAMKL